MKIKLIRIEIPISSFVLELSVTRSQTEKNRIEEAEFMLNTIRGVMSVEDFTAPGIAAASRCR